MRAYPIAAPSARRSDRKPVTTTSPAEQLVALVGLPDEMTRFRACVVT
jgi:hypothetical protein